MKTGPKPNTFAALIGIDWADKKHDFCLWDTRDETTEPGRIEHRSEVLHDWVCSL